MHTVAASIFSIEAVTLHDDSWSALQTVRSGGARKGERGMQRGEDDDCWRLIATVEISDQGRCGGAVVDDWKEAGRTAWTGKAHIESTISAPKTRPSTSPSKSSSLHDEDFQVQHDSATGLVARLWCSGGDMVARLGMEVFEQQF
ncbi:hypothetical protein SESBI_10872 [Sesbania bispinosa]|nr:hypothetical protein SESBI_10872 [Sesbania bispinosa]